MKEEIQPDEFTPEQKKAASMIANSILSDIATFEHNKKKLTEACFIEVFGHEAGVTHWRKWIESGIDLQSYGKNNFTEDQKTNMVHYLKRKS